MMVPHLMYPAVGMVYQFKVRQVFEYLRVSNILYLVYTVQSTWLAAHMPPGITLISPPS